MTSPRHEITPFARRVVALGLAAGALIASGCGDDEPEGPSPAEQAAIAQEEYEQEVREAFQLTFRETKQLEEDIEDANSLGQFVEPLGDTSDSYRRSAERLESLDPPARVRQLHRSLIELQREVAQAAATAQQAARNNNREGIAEFDEAGDDYSRRARKLSDQFRERGFEL